MIDKDEDRLLKLEDFVSREKHRQEYRKEQIVKLELAVVDKKKDSDILLKVAELFKSLGGESEIDLLKKLDQFVSGGLSFIFGESYTFKSFLNVSGKDVRLDFTVNKDGKDLSTVEDSCGGGVVDVVGLLLRLFFIVSMKDSVMPFLILDTALIQLSDEFVPRMSKLLKDVCDGLGIQLVLITHTNLFGEFADALYEFSQEHGKTISKRLK